MKIMIDQLFVEWDDLQSPEEFKIMKKYAETGRRYSLGYSCKNESRDIHSRMHLLFASFVNKIII